MMTTAPSVVDVDAPAPAPAPAGTQGQPGLGLGLAKKLADSANASMDDLSSLATGKGPANNNPKRTLTKKVSSRKLPAAAPVFDLPATKPHKKEKPVPKSQDEVDRESLTNIMKRTDAGPQIEALVKRHRALRKRIDRIEKYQHNDPSTLNRDQLDSITALPGLRGAQRELEDLLRLLAPMYDADQAALALLNKQHARALASARKQALAEGHDALLAVFKTYVHLVRELVELDPEDATVAQLRNVFFDAERAVEASKLVSAKDEGEVQGASGVTYAQVYTRLIEAPLRLEDLLAPPEFMASADEDLQPQQQVQDDQDAEIARTLGEDAQVAEVPNQQLDQSRPLTPQFGFHAQAEPDLDAARAVSDAENQHQTAYPMIPTFLAPPVTTADAAADQPAATHKDPLTIPAAMVFAETTSEATQAKYDSSIAEHVAQLPLEPVTETQEDIGAEHDESTDNQNEGEGEGESDSATTPAAGAAQESGDAAKKRRRPRGGRGRRRPSGAVAGDAGANSPAEGGAATGQQQPRGPRQPREHREPREPRQPREPREPRDPNVNANAGPRAPRGDRPPRRASNKPVATPAVATAQ
ncbi:hypothetical protein BCR44DRAFT_81452 [Catenaria anguillulae PL171]|uniref:Uncharacterized protein n=1 Tax=Catenaria anguillulae PL171 TaxID=765915 RepID=A0A1Y2HPB0_9FUNG|nr:hypothetical protein BCR44DRAFT_81452 [Catenaria anguillulae PL171]